MCSVPSVKPAPLPLPQPQLSYRSPSCVRTPQNKAREPYVSPSSHKQSTQPSIRPKPNQGQSASRVPRCQTPERCGTRHTCMCRVARRLLPHRAAASTRHGHTTCKRGQGGKRSKRLDTIKLRVLGGWSSTRGHTNRTPYLILSFILSYLYFARNCQLLVKL